MRALISVSDKAGLIPFAEGLVALGFELISTGGTFKVLQEKGISVVSIDTVTGLPEMMDGRVKTLHPKIHGGLLAMRDNPVHMQACKTHEIGLIDLVIVNLYPFEKTIANPNVHLEEAIENIDIGGPSMIRSASKNYRSVGVIVNPARYTSVLEELRTTKGTLSLKTKESLAIEAFQHTASYDAIIYQFLSKNIGADQSIFPERITPVLTKVADLRYGENPHQHSAKRLPIAVFLSGSGSNFQAILRAVQSGALHADIKAVISDNPEAPGVAIAKQAGILTWAKKISDFDSKSEYTQQFP